MRKQRHCLLNPPRSPPTRYPLWLQPQAGSRSPVDGQPCYKPWRVSVAVCCLGCQSSCRGGNRKGLWADADGQSTLLASPFDNRENRWPNTALAMVPGCQTQLKFRSCSNTLFAHNPTKLAGAFRNGRPFKIGIKIGIK